MSVVGTVVYMRTKYVPVKTPIPIARTAGMKFRLILKNIE